MAWRWWTMAWRWWTMAWRWWTIEWRWWTMAWRWWTMAWRWWTIAWRWWTMAWLQWTKVRRRLRWTIAWCQWTTGASWRLAERVRVRSGGTCVHVRARGRVHVRARLRACASGGGKGGTVLPGEAANDAFLADDRLLYAGVEAARDSDGGGVWAVEVEVLGDHVHHGRRAAAALP